MASYSEILKAVLPAVLGSAFSGGAATKAIRAVSSKGGSKAIRAVSSKGGSKASDILKGAVLTYPGLTETFNYPIVFAPNPGGYANDNASVDRYLAEDGALAQTLVDHNEAVRRGDESKLSSWWPGKDRQPRSDFHPSSSAVSDVHINPDNTISIRFGGKGKWYTYARPRNVREASEIAKSLLTSPSIGRALAGNGHLRHNGRSDKEGTPDPNVGWWARKYRL